MTNIFEKTVAELNDLPGINTTILEDEADIKQGKISISSPIARALIGKVAKDVALVQAPGGQHEYEILAVRYE